MVDKLFKVGLLVIGIVLLVLFYQFSQNNRFYFHQDKDAIFDTRTGKVYAIDKEEQKWIVGDPISGEVKDIPWKRVK